MDPNQFDALVKNLGSGHTRRVALRWIAGTLVAAGFLTPDTGRGKASPEHGRSGLVDASSATASRRQKRPACAFGLTRCPAGKTRRGKRRHVCVNLLTHTRHCGTCGRVCPPGERCQSGGCTRGGHCTADCDSKSCGPDGCGGSCGRCEPYGAGTRCCDGHCVQGDCCEDADCASGQTCGVPGAPYLCSASCGPAQCFGCCNGTACVNVPDQNNQTCGVGGITCIECVAGTFCQDGHCTCRSPGELCNPADSPDQCCAFQGAVCVAGANNPSFGVCCLPDGTPCDPSGVGDCFPGTGCCCSGNCGSSGICESSA
ncbi:MAG: hypothetical protein U0031_12195 [Thermomicrobiales bacterium]